MVLSTPGVPSVKWLGPLELVRMIGANKSVAFVGNGAGIAGSRLGPLIDKWDIIVRFNLCQTLGYEKDVGGRTTVLVVNALDPALRSPLRERFPDAPPKVLFAIPPIEQTFDEIIQLDNYCLPEDTEYCFFSFPTTSSLDRAMAIAHNRLHGWTTGTYGIYMLCEMLRPAKVLITAFDMFSLHEAHYFDDGSSAKRRVTRNHNLELERNCWAQLLGTMRCPVFATRDVRSAISSAAVSSISFP